MPCRTEYQATVVEELNAVDTVTADTRYSFAPQFLCFGALCARRAAEIERQHPTAIDDPTRTEHLGCVTAAVMQSAAAVEAQAAELLIHGPGAHLGSDGVDRQAHEFLAPLAEIIDGQQTQERYRLILHLLGKGPPDMGHQSWQDMLLLIRLRNEITHYKSQWGQDMDKKKLFVSLRNLRLARPPFIHVSQNFFPHQLLGAKCAAWAVSTSVAFLNDFYGQLRISSPLDAYEAQFRGL